MTTTNDGGQRAKLCLDGWAGRREVDVVVNSTTAKRATVELLEGALLPSRGGYRPAGATVTVPKSALCLPEPLAVKCKRCKGTGSVADYVGDEMRCIETECPDCRDSGRTTLSTATREQP